MIRRFPVVLAAAAAVASMTSACSTFTSNANAAEVNDHELDIDQFGQLAEELIGPDGFGYFRGGDARSLLTEWVTAYALTDALAERGVVIDEATRTATATTLAAENAERWAAVSDRTKDELVTIRAAKDAVEASQVEQPSDDEVRAIYDSGPDASGIICVRLIGTADAAEAAEIKAALDGGADFGAVADDHLPEGTDPATAPEGGAYVDPNTGSSCATAAGLVDEVYAAIAGAAIGEVAQFDFQGSTIFMLQRPFDEVADDAIASIAPTLTGDAVAAATSELLAGADVMVDSRYGSWDSETNRVVPIR